MPALPAMTAPPDSQIGIAGLTLPTLRRKSVAGMEIYAASFANDPAATRVVDDLTKGKWRRARDAAKDLCKKDRPRYLPLLIAANAGLADDLIRRGLTQDAAPILENLKSIAPPEVVARLEARFSEQKMATVLRKGDDSQAGDVSRAETVRAVKKLDEGGTLSAIQIEAVDRAVADGGPWVADAGNAAEAKAAAEFDIVQRALEASGGGRWEEAQEALRSLPRQSVFQHWRLFLRGIRCVHTRDLATAAQCFDALPPGSATARAATFYREWAGLPPVNNAKPLATVPLVEAYVALCGAPAAWGPVIARAHHHWKNHRRAEAFDELRDGLSKSAFPDSAPGLAGALTELVLCPSCSDPSEVPAFEDLLEHLDAIVARKRFRSDREEYHLLRTLTMADEKAMPPAQFEISWTRLMELDRRLSGPSNIRDAIIYGLIGSSIIGREIGLDMNATIPDPNRKLSKSSSGLKALKQAVKLDPENEGLLEELASAFHFAGDSVARDRHFDIVMSRFPHRKSVFVQAIHAANSEGNNARARACAKAAKAAHPLDREFDAALASSLLRQLVPVGKKRVVSPGPGFWDELEPLLIGPPSPLPGDAGSKHILMARWVVRLRRAIIEGDRTVADAAMQDAIDMAPSPPARILMEQGLRQIYNYPARAALKSEWTAAIGEATWLDALWVFLGASFVAAIPAASQSLTSRQEQAVRAILTKLRPSLTNHPREVLDFVRIVESTQGNLNHSYDVYEAASASMREALGRFRGNAKADPRIRLAYWIVSADDFEANACRYAHELRSIVKDAEKHGHSAAAEDVRTLLRRAETDPARGAPEPDYGFLPDSPSIDTIVAPKLFGEAFDRELTGEVRRILRETNGSPTMVELLKAMVISLMALPPEERSGLAADAIQNGFPMAAVTKVLDLARRLVHSPNIPEGQFLPAELDRAHKAAATKSSPARPPISGPGPVPYTPPRPRPKKPARKPASDAGQMELF